VASTCRWPTALSGSSVGNRPAAIASVIAWDTSVSRTTSLTPATAPGTRYARALRETLSCRLPSSRRPAIAPNTRPMVAQMTTWVASPYSRNS
jgi:cell wall-associated NlpC family hydrolase